MLQKTPSLLPTHPAAAPRPAAPPCDQCSALCCRYFAMQLDTPEDAADFDSIKWYLLHQDAWIWVDDGDWYLQVDRPCRFLGADSRCTIYDTRPQICRDYGLPEKLDNDDDPLCDYFAQDAHHDHEFREPHQLDAYVETFLAEREAKRRKRSEAAIAAWKKKKKKGRRP